MSAERKTRPSHHILKKLTIRKSKEIPLYHQFKMRQKKSEVQKVSLQVENPLLVMMTLIILLRINQLKKVQRSEDLRQ